MNKFKMAIYRFMQGRYGGDSLNTFLYVLVFSLLFLNLLFFRTGIVTILVYVLLALIIFRMYSRNIYKRQSENQKFKQLTAPIRKRFTVLKKNHSDKTHKHFLCPNCSQLVRVPKGKGTIEIKCPKCSTHFSKKS